MWPTIRWGLLGMILVALLSLPASAQLTLTSSGSNQYGGGVPLVSCASTGIYDLSNVCNDIYFIGGLK